MRVRVEATYAPPSPGTVLIKNKPPKSGDVPLRLESILFKFEYPRPGGWQAGWEVPPVKLVNQWTDWARPVDTLVDWSELFFMIDFPETSTYRYGDANLEANLWRQALAQALTRCGATFSWNFFKKDEPGQGVPTKVVDHKMLCPPPRPL